MICEEPEGHNNARINGCHPLKDLVGASSSCQIFKLEEIICCYNVLDG